MTDLKPEWLFALKQGAIYMRAGYAGVAIDPSSTSCGWAVRLPMGGQLHSGQDPTVWEACKRVRTLVGYTQPIGFLFIEEPSFVGKGQQWKLAWAGGEAHGRLAGQMADENCIMRATEASWRSAVFGFNRGLDREGGETANSRIHEWAEARLGHPLRAGEGAEIDRANALAMLATCEQLMTEQGAGT